IHSTLSIFSESELGRKKDIGIVRLVDLDAIRMRFTCEPGQLRLGIEKVHLAGSAVLNELDHGLCFSGKLGAPRPQIVVDRDAGGCCRFSPKWIAEKIREHDAAEPQTA